MHIPKVVFIFTMLGLVTSVSFVDEVINSGAELGHSTCRSETMKIPEGENGDKLHRDKKHKK